MSETKDTLVGPAAGPPANGNSQNIPIIADDMPVMFEDEGQEEMGESTPHTDADHILLPAIQEHLRARPQYRVFSNLNLYYHERRRWAYVSPDLMVVIPSRPLPPRLGSYRIGQDGPAPVLTLEILSRRSFQQQDLTDKPDIYSRLGVCEYILVDTTGEFLPQCLLLRRLQEDGSWTDEQDADGGVTSALGFRLVLDSDGRLRVVDAASGRPYVRPDEAERRIRELEEELRRLRSEPLPRPNP